MTFSRGRMGPQESPTSERRSGEEGNRVAAGISRVDVHHTTAVRSLNALNENIRSLLQVNFSAYGVARPSTLVSLSLHSNRVSSFEGFSAMTVSPACFRLSLAVAAGSTHHTSLQKLVCSLASRRRALMIHRRPRRSVIRVSPFSSFLCEVWVEAILSTLQVGSTGTQGNTCVERSICRLLLSRLFPQLNCCFFLPLECGIYRVFYREVTRLGLSLCISV